jgi:lipopolysaccharide biosynthesis glycosyltransferase
MMQVLTRASQVSLNTAARRAISITDDCRMNIVYIFSNNWLPYLMVQLANLLSHNPGVMRIYLVCDGMNTAERAYTQYVLHMLRAVNRAQVIVIDAEGVYKDRITSDINVTPNFTRFTLYRLLLPSLLPANLTKVLYIDSDTLVLKPLSELYHRRLGKNFLGAVRDPGALDRKQQLGFADHEDYFNAGVLLLNLLEIRKHNLEVQWLRMANETQFPWPDQDILNITCRGKVSWLPPPFNSFGGAVARKDEKVIHYIVQKPWRNHTVPRYKAWSRARRNFDKRMSKIPKILHWIIIENEKEPAGNQARRLANAEILDDFEIHIHCLGSASFTFHPEWRQLFEKRQFTDLRFAAAQHFVTELGGVYISDSVHLLQPIDALLRYKAFTSGFAGHGPPQCFGSIPYSDMLPSSKTHQLSQEEITMYWKVSKAESWTSQVWLRFVRFSRN